MRTEKIKYHPIKIRHNRCDDCDLYHEDCNKLRHNKLLPASCESVVYKKLTIIEQTLY